jgi:hypothetical protein
MQQHVLAGLALRPKHNLPATFETAGGFELPCGELEGACYPNIGLLFTDVFALNFRGHVPAFLSVRKATAAPYWPVCTLQITL